MKATVTPTDGFEQFLTGAHIPALRLPGSFPWQKARRQSGVLGAAEMTTIGDHKANDGGPQAVSSSSVKTAWKHHRYVLLLAGLACALGYYRIDKFPRASQGGS